jgi:hypothetical protein
VFYVSSKRTSQVLELRSHALSGVKTSEEVPGPERRLVVSSRAEGLIYLDLHAHTADVPELAPAVLPKTTGYTAIDEP